MNSGRDLPTSWASIIEQVRLYPSPHNSQPIKLQVHDQFRATVFYDMDLGLPAENFGIPFAHVCAGVFLESLRTVAQAQGYDVQEDIDEAELDFAASRRLHPVAQVRLQPATLSPSQQEQAEARVQAFLRRRTSRRPYRKQLVPEHVVNQARELAHRHGHSFATTTDPACLKRLVRLNQETLFDDLRNDAVHAEILTWMRTSARQAQRTGDGLSAQTLMIPGPVLGFAMRHRGLWELPVIGALVRGVYLNTMRGVHQMGWMVGSFAGPGDYLRAGRAFMDLWLHLTHHGVYLHPLGTVITNPRSRRQMVEMLGIDEREQAMAWLLFRYGYSKAPSLAHRRPARHMVVSA